MKTGRPHSRRKTEARRFQAIRDFRNGMPAKMAAQKHHVRVDTLYSWIGAVKRAGSMSALLSTKAPGRAPRLRLEQKLAIFNKKPDYYDAEATRWTGPLVAKAVWEEYGVRYSANWAQELIRKHAQ